MNANTLVGAGVAAAAGYFFGQPIWPGFDAKTWAAIAGGSVIVAELTRSTLATSTGYFEPTVVIFSSWMPSVLIAIAGGRLTIVVNNALGINPFGLKDYAPAMAYALTLAVRLRY